MLQPNTPLFDLFAHKEDIHQSDAYAQVMERIGWTIEHPSETSMFVRKLGPVSVAKIQRPSLLSIDALHELQRKYKTLATYIEPSLTTTINGTALHFPHFLPSSIPSRQDQSFLYPQFGLQRITTPFAFSATSLIDLRLSQLELKKRLKQKTRYNLHLAVEKKHVQIHTVPLGSLQSSDVTLFFRLKSEWSARKHVFGYDDQLLHTVLETFHGKGWCLFAEVHGKVEAALLLLHHQHSALYYSVFSTDLGDAAYVPTALAWKALCVAQQFGCDVFDFGGMYDPRYPKQYKGWKGFTRFKEGFSPTPLLYPPTFVWYGW